jgi:hypothetical protein
MSERYTCMHDAIRMNMFAALAIWMGSGVQMHAVAAGLHLCLSLQRPEDLHRSRHCQVRISRSNALCKASVTPLSIRAAHLLTLEPSAADGHALHECTTMLPCCCAPFIRVATVLADSLKPSSRVSDPSGAHGRSPSASAC